MRWALALLLIAAPLAGCLGGSSEDEPIRKARVELREGQGSVTGIVTDLAVQPILAATVRVAGLDLAATTQADGSFAINGIPPGAYAIEAGADGYVPATLPIEIVANAVSTADFVLTPLVSNAAFTELFELNGFLECSIRAGANLTSVGGPNQAPGLAACAVPNDVQENTTNDRFIHYFDFEAPVETIVYQMQWDARGNQMGLELKTLLEVDGWWNTDPATFIEVAGPSPITLRVDKTRFAEVNDWFVEQCDADSASTACGYNFWDQGWPVTLRVFPGFDCVSETVVFCLPIQQDFRHLVEVWYNAPAPDGYLLQ